MIIESLFDGMSCAYIAAERAGLNITKYYASEVDKYATKVSENNYPNIIRLGDVTKWREWEHKEVDLLTAGSPCQGFSAAGKQGGTKAILEGMEIIVSTLEQYEDVKSKGAEFLSQSHLFWEFVGRLRYLQSIGQAKYFMLENVRMSKENNEMITKALGVEPIEINSSLVSAQNRRRLYWTNIPNLEQPKDKHIYWGDVREKGVIKEKYYYGEKAMQWLGRASQRLGKTLDVHSNSEKMQMLEASHHKKYSNQRFFGIVDMPKDKECIAAMRGRYLVNGVRTGEDKSLKGITKQYVEFRYDNKSNCLTTVKKDNIVVPFTLPNRVPLEEFFFRYITPLECERLQTVPENYTSCVSDSQRYKMLGNGWTVDVIAHILKGLKGD